MSSCLPVSATAPSLASSNPNSYVSPNRLTRTEAHGSLPIAGGTGALLLEERYSARRRETNQQTRAPAATPTMSPMPTFTPSPSHRQTPAPARARATRPPIKDAVANINGLGASHPDNWSCEVVKKVLLAVFAHPDDETFGTGGTLALYAKRDFDVHLICATGGELGESPTDLRGFASVAEMRESELQCAASVLGLKTVQLLGYRDSGMQGSTENHHPRALVSAPVEDVARRIAGHIRVTRPQVVITSDPVGGYGHPDHIAIHLATVAAFQMAQDPELDIDGLQPHTPQRLYYSTFPRRLLRWVVRLMLLLRRDPRRFGHNKDIDLLSVAEADFPIHAAVPIQEVRSLKEQAARCHASQLGDIGRVAKWLQRLMDRTEVFTRAIPAEPPVNVQRDLFEGVT